MPIFFMIVTSIRNNAIYLHVYFLTFPSSDVSSMTADALPVLFTAVSPGTGTYHTKGTEKTFVKMN